MFRIFRTFCLSALLLFALPAVLRGQVASGSGDAAFTFGYTHVKGVTSSSHYVLGGSGAFNFSHYVAAGFEYTYTPLGSETLSIITDSGNQRTYGGFGRFSLVAPGRITPYLLAGGGAVNEKEVFATNIFITTASQSGYYYALGAGASIFGGRHWGVRPELRYEHQQFCANNRLNLNAFGQNDIQLTVQLFYQGGGK